MLPTAEGGPFVVLDSWGQELSAARLPVETFTGCHDSLRDMMCTVAAEGGVKLRISVALRPDM